jgi:hypothetical protein
MQFNLRKLFKVLALMAILFCAVVLRLNYINSVPKAPVYNQSILVNEVSHNRPGVFYPLITYEYTSADAAEKIIQFYSRDALCEENDFIEGSRIVCSGEATPFGEYRVYIDSAQSASAIQTTYAIETRWERVPIISFELLILIVGCLLFWILSLTFARALGR